MLDRPAHVASVLALAGALGAFGCGPPTILSANTVKKEPARVFPQLNSALAPAGYTCEDGTDDHSYEARCKGASGGITIEVKRKTERPVLAIRFWVRNKQCTETAFLARVEQFNMQDAAGGTRAYCVEDRLVFAFDTYMPTQGVEAKELGALVARWEKNAGRAAERFGLFGDEGDAPAPASE